MRFLCEIMNCISHDCVQILFIVLLLKRLNRNPVCNDVTNHVTNDVISAIITFLRSLGSLCAVVEHARKVC